MARVILTQEVLRGALQGIKKHVSPQHLNRGPGSEFAHFCIMQRVILWLGGSENEAANLTYDYTGYDPYETAATVALVRRCMELNDAGVTWHRIIDGICDEPKEPQAVPETPAPAIEEPQPVQPL